MPRIASVVTLLVCSTTAALAQSQDPGENLGQTLADFQTGRVEEAKIGARGAGAAPTALLPY
ncbi:MAG: hypothetical protein IH849_09480 [Acidobacteria bacterium]|nr:hypothetical protein [Acidobacteriota bacterium]